MLCIDHCVSDDTYWTYHIDGYCDDSAGIYGFCAIGYDCSDCGVRRFRRIYPSPMQPAPPAPPPSPPLYPPGSYAECSSANNTLCDLTLCFDHCRRFTDVRARHRVERLIVHCSHRLLPTPLLAALRTPVG